jgi:2'-5' RNA ligase
MSGSPQGRRILIAVVTGEVGATIQAWRAVNDPEEAVRLPPHTTLCYWAPDVDPDVLEQQVRHAFPAPVTVQLGGVHEFENREQTFFIEVLDTEALDAARETLYDGSIVELPRDRNWTWHVTCVRRSTGRDRAELQAALAGFTVNAPWTIDTIAYMELRDKKYETIAEWKLASVAAER